MDVSCPSLCCLSFLSIIMSAALPFHPSYEGFPLEHLEVKDLGMEEFGRWSKDMQTLEWSMW